MEGLTTGIWVRQIHAACRPSMLMPRRFFSTISSASVLTKGLSLKVALQLLVLHGCDAFVSFASANAGTLPMTV